MHPLLVAPFLLATPRLELATDCAPSPTVGWQNALYHDADADLFRQEGFLDVTAWGDDAEGDPTAGQLIADCFGDPTPHSGLFVLHHLAPPPGAPPRARPVLLVPGAGDNAIRSYTFMALALRLAGFQTYAITFAHRHGDNFLQAEQVANAIALITARHPRVKVDVVAHSKGGMPARIYASNHPGAIWPEAHAAYAAQGTRYRDDIGRLFFFGAPLGGLDTSFRWPSANFFPVYGTPLDSPVSWTDFYPGGNVFLGIDLEPNSLYGGAESNFPGQAQMLWPWDDVYPLPGSNPTLGVYAAVQQDWFTTYHGGFGFVSYSHGIDDAIEGSGDVIGAVQATGVDRDIELYLVAGGNPILSAAGLGGAAFALWWSDGDAAAQRTFWQEGVEAVLDLYYPWWPAFEDELPRLVAGTGFLGEISGPSDGVLFVDSALDDTGLTRRGAEVVEARLFEALNHVELLAAGALFAEFHANPDNGFFDPDLAAKYARPENQVVEWLIRVLSQPVDDAPPAPDGGVEADGGIEDGGVEDGGVDATLDAMPDAMPDAMFDAMPEADGGAGDAAADDSGAASDAAAEDMHAPPADAAAPDDMAAGDVIDGAVALPDASGADDDDGGGTTGCHAAPGTDRAPAWLAGLWGAALLRRRRRARH